MADNFNTRLYARTYGAPAARAPSTAPNTQTTTTTCAPACVCGQLECLCRPRFFAGQLLTEQDLNRLDAYIRAKNRLHNLQLHGWGVVNGLIVHCDACGNGVTVGSGYAISPCGEDIIVCSDTAVDVCSLVKKCTPPDVSCMPSAASSGTGCDDLAEDWVLCIRYSETPTRGVTALRMGPTCSCGATGGNCGCGGATCATPTTTQKPRNPPPECEPTAICEGYSFDVFRAPQQSGRKQPSQIGGALVEAFECCLQSLFAAIPAAPGQPGAASYAQSPAAWNTWCCRTKAALIGYFSTGAQWDCTLVSRLQSVSCPAVGSQTFATDMDSAVATYVSVLADALISCLCNALLPPPPAGTSDDRVPLAIIGVRKKDCTVVSVCNWTSLRKLVLTAPTLEYWLSWIPWLGSLGDIIGQLCCRDFELNALAPGLGAYTINSANLALNPTLDAEQVSANQMLRTLVQNAVTRASTPLDAASVVSSFFGVGQAAQTLSATEQANPAPFLLINEVLRPIINSVVTQSSTAGNTDSASLSQRLSSLEAQMAKLQKG